MSDILKFEGKYAFLSNFFHSPMEFNGYYVKTAENAFQMMKTEDKNLRKEIASSFSPYDAKQRGRKVPLRSDWENIKLDIMYQVVKTKFDMHPDLKEMLLETNDSYLEEGNYWHDNFWGNCSCYRCIDKEGKNHLGEILMKIREEYRNNAIK